MRIKKSHLSLIGIIALIVSLVGGIFYLQMDVRNVWADETSWSTGSVITYDADVWQNRTVTTDDGTKTVTIPYCLMYEVSKADSGVVTYKCSLAPLYFAGLKKLNYEETQFASDVVVTYPKDGVMPTAFLNNAVVNTTTIGSIGNDPVPVSIMVSVHEAERKASFFSVLGHYWKFRVARQKDMVSQQLLSWNVTQLPTDALSDKDLKAWAAKAMTDMKNLYGYDELMALDGNAFLNYLRDKFAYQAAVCTPIEDPCTFAYGQNPTSNILLFLYAASIDKDPIFNKFLTIARTKAQPFAPTLVLPTAPPCTNGSDCPEQDFQDMQSYEFPICPVRDIAAGNLNTDAVKLFSEFMKAYATKASGEYIFAKSEINSELALLKAKIEKIAAEDIVPTKLDSAGVTTYNRLCASVVGYGMTDAVTVKNLQDTMMTLKKPVLGKISLEDGSQSFYTQLSDLKKIAASSYLQGTFSSFVPNEGIAKTELLNGIESRKAAVAENRFSAGIPLTLMLIYLFK